MGNKAYYFAIIPHGTNVLLKGCKFKKLLPQKISIVFLRITYLIISLRISRTRWNKFFGVTPASHMILLINSTSIFGSKADRNYFTEMSLFGSRLRTRRIICIILRGATKETQNQYEYKVHLQLTTTHLRMVFGEIVPEISHLLKQHTCFHHYVYYFSNLLTQHLSDYKQRSLILITKDQINE